MFDKVSDVRLEGDVDRVPTTVAGKVDAAQRTFTVRRWAGRRDTHVIASSLPAGLSVSAFSYSSSAVSSLPRRSFSRARPNTGLESGSAAR